MGIHASDTHGQINDYVRLAKALRLSALSLAGKDPIFDLDKDLRLILLCTLKVFCVSEL